MIIYLKCYFDSIYLESHPGDKCIVTLMSNNVCRFLKFWAFKDRGFYCCSVISFRNRPNLSANLRNVFLFIFFTRIVLIFKTRSK